MPFTNQHSCIDRIATQEMCLCSNPQCVNQARRVRRAASERRPFDELRQCSIGVAQDLQEQRIVHVGTYCRIMAGAEQSWHTMYLPAVKAQSSISVLVRDFEITEHPFKWLSSMMSLKQQPTIVLTARNAEKFVGKTASGLNVARDKGHKLLTPNRRE